MARLKLFSDRPPTFSVSLEEPRRRSNEIEVNGKLLLTRKDYVREGKRDERKEGREERRKKGKKEGRMEGGKERSE